MTTLLRFKTHNDSDIDVNGTSHQGEISETFENLLKVFGTPMGASDDGKVDVEWNIKFNDGVVATIYNWKNGPNYCGETGLHHNQIFEWHVGGFDQRALEQVVYALLGEIKCFT